MDGVAVLERLAAAVERIADKLGPPPPADIVGSPWIAARLGSCGRVSFSSGLRLLF